MGFPHVWWGVIFVVSLYCPGFGSSMCLCSFKLVCPCIGVFVQVLVVVSPSVVPGSHKVQVVFYVSSFVLFLVVFCYVI